MALNKIERELLVAARELIESGEEYFLCFAIASATPQHYYYAYAANRLDLYISEALAPHVSLETWQRANGYSARRDGKQDRLAWVDWMLDQPEVE
jgi:hypothetical protein